MTWESLERLEHMMPFGRGMRNPPLNTSLQGRKAATNHNRVQKHCRRPRIRAAVKDLAESASLVDRCVKDHRPDLILMDVQRAGEDGLALTRRLKAQTPTTSIPVIALSAHAMSAQKQEALAAGCAGYITKPIDTRTFVDQIKGILAIVPKPAQSLEHNSQEATTA